MSTNEPMVGMLLPMLSGIQIIPSDDVPCGYRRTEGDTIFINPANYELMRPLSAKGTLIVLGILGEMSNE